jgi:hypothetical protein
MSDTQQQPNAVDKTASSEGASMDSVSNCDGINELKELKLKMVALEEKHKKEIYDWKVGKKTQFFFANVHHWDPNKKFYFKKHGKSCPNTNMKLVNYQSAGTNQTFIYFNIL